MPLALSRRRVLTGAAALAAMPRRARADAGFPWNQPVYGTGASDSIDPVWGISRARPFHDQDIYYLFSNNENPHSADGTFPAATWDPSARTGLQIPACDRARFQRGIINPFASDLTQCTVAQQYGDTVAVFINTADLVNGGPSPGASAPNAFKQMITYEIDFSNVSYSPWAGSGALRVVFDLKVPSSSVTAPLNPDGNSFINWDALLQVVPQGRDEDNLRIGLAVKIFNLGTGFSTADNVHLDGPTGTIVCACALGASSAIVTTESGSEVTQGAVFSDFRSFAFRFTRANIQAIISDPDVISQALALRSLVTNGRTIPLPNGMRIGPGDFGGYYQDPAHYLVNAQHLNAEEFALAPNAYNPGDPAYPSTLGWAMRGHGLAVV